MTAEKIQYAAVGEQAIALGCASGILLLLSFVSSDVRAVTLFRNEGISYLSLSSGADIVAWYV